MIFLLELLAAVCGALLVALLIGFAPFWVVAGLTVVVIVLTVRGVRDAR